jgi:hypothetical protein
VEIFQLLWNISKKPENMQECFAGLCKLNRKITKIRDTIFHASAWKTQRTNKDAYTELAVEIS